MKTIKELLSLKDRVALVTGAAGHIGKAICETFAENGASIVILDLDAEKCRQVAEKITKKYSVKTLSLGIDLLNEIEVKSVPDLVLDKFEKIDILVNCAAYVGTSNLSGWSSDFAEQMSSTWREALEVNLTVPFVLTQSCVSALRASSCASIINIGSIYGLIGPDMRLYGDTDMGNPAAYAASKGGLLQLTRWLATVLAPDIRVNSISAGGISRNQPAIFQNRYVERTPLRRMGKEEDLIGAAVYLASDLSAYVTGQNLVVDGGWTIW